MAKNNFKDTVDTLFSGMERVFSTKTVVGDPKKVGDALIVPLVDVSFGMGSGDFGKEASESSVGGMNGKMSPSAILIIKDGSTRLVHIKATDAMNKVLDMVPDAVDKISNLIHTKGREDQAVLDTVNDIMSEEDEVLNDSLDVE